VHAIRRILVAVRDPDARPSSALTKAAQLARALGARLELFHALTWPIYASSEGGFRAQAASERRLALAHLRRLASRLRRTSRLTAIGVSAAWDSPTYEAILRRARAWHADLIVAERHHGRHVGASLLQMNDWELLRHSPVPVLLVKQGGRYRRGLTVLAAVDPAHEMDKPARLDDEILAASAAVAQGLGGRLHTVHANGSVTAMAPARRVLNAEEAALRYRRLVGAAQHRYEHLLDRHGILPARRHLLNLPPADAIEDVAQRLHAQIVAVGAISRTGWQRLLFGNTAEALLDPLPCDLLVVKPPHFKSRIARQPLGPRCQVPVPLIP